MGATEDFIRDKAGKLGEPDFLRALRNAGGILGKLAGPLSMFAGQLRLLVSMLRDYHSGRYRRLPVWTIGVVAFALLYVLNPFDAVPDFIPVVGLADDALVMAAALSMVGQDLKDYRRWLVKERWRARRECRKQNKPQE